MPAPSDHPSQLTPPSEYFDSAPPSALTENAEAFSLSAPVLPAEPTHLPFSALSAIAGNASGQAALPQNEGQRDGSSWAPQTAAAREPEENLNALASLKPLGQLRESFILATNDEGLWLIDQHVAHERVLFEKILRERAVEQVQRQRLLMPLLIDLQPHQMVLFARIARELERNGFEAEPFGPSTLAIKAAPIGLEGRALERMLSEVLEQVEREQTENLEAARTRIAASIACHSASRSICLLTPNA